MHIQGQSRDQATLFPERLDDLIGQDNAVRVIDAFVGALDLADLGFSKAVSARTGRPPYHPADLLKLFLYGYLHQIRSTRRLERECHRNIELLWLLNRLAPDFKTIANFRADNPKALINVCRAFVQFCRGQGLYGGKLVAVDGSKFRASNNADRVIRPADLEHQLAAVDRQITRWLETLGESESGDQGGDDDDDDGAGRTQEALEALKTQRESLMEQLHKMRDEGLTSQAQTDPEARLMKGRGVGYNVQSTVDGKHHLIVDHEVVRDTDDRKQLYRMARRAKRVLAAQAITVLADGGYSNGRLLGKCEAHDVEVYLPVNRTHNHKRDGRYFDRSEFTYDAQADQYQCPAGNILHKHSRSIKQRLNKYTSDACGQCPIKSRCTAAKQRFVTRHFDEEALEQTAQRTADNAQMMRRRKAMVEHPFGTLKRRMDGGKFLLRGIKKVRTEMALAVTAYNLTRAINVIGVRRLCEALA